MSKMTSKSKFATNWICLLLAGTLVCSGTLLAQTAEKPKRNLLFIGQAKGYQHEAISTAMATLYNLGRSSGLWNTQLRTDCTAITKKPLKWEAKNLDAFDAIVFFTDTKFSGPALSNPVPMTRIEASSPNEPAARARA